MCVYYYVPLLVFFTKQHFCCNDEMQALFSLTIRVLSFIRVVLLLCIEEEKSLMKREKKKNHRANHAYNNSLVVIVVEKATAEEANTYTRRTSLYMLAQKCCPMSLFFRFFHST